MHVHMTHAQPLPKRKMWIDDLNYEELCQALRQRWHGKVGKLPFHLEYIDPEDPESDPISITCTEELDIAVRALYVCTCLWSMYAGHALMSRWISHYVGV